MATLPMIGMVLALLGLLWLIVVVFKEGGVLWGIGALFMPPLALLLAALNWSETVKSPVLLFSGGVAMLAAAAALGLD